MQESVCVREREGRKGAGIPKTLEFRSEIKHKKEEKKKEEEGKKGRRDCALVCYVYRSYEVNAAGE